MFPGGQLQFDAQCYTKVKAGSESDSTHLASCETAQACHTRVQ